MNMVKFYNKLVVMSRIQLSFSRPRIETREEIRVKLGVLALCCAGSFIDPGKGALDSTRCRESYTTATATVTVTKTNTATYYVRLCYVYQQQQLS